MGRIYTASFAAVAVSAAQDILAIAMDSTNLGVIHEVGLSNLTEAGDSEEEMLRLRLRSGQTSAGSGGASVTPRPVLVGDSAADATVRRNDTTIASGGTIVTHYTWGWNIRIPFVHVWTPETRPILAPSRRGTFELTVAPGDPITMSGYIVFEEIG